MSPLTSLEVAAIATVLQLSGPYAVQVMVPVAGVVVPLIDGYVKLVPSLAGLLAVPLRVAVSLSVFPTTHGSAAAFVLSTQLADVDSVGVLGVTVKHSPVPSSSWALTPAAFEVVLGSKWACQQYCPEPVPADVRVAVELPVIPESAVL